MQAYVSQAQSDNTAVGTLDRPTFIFNFRNCSSPSPLLGPSGTPKQSPTTGQEGTRMDQESLTDLHWWIHEARKTNGPPIVPPVANLVIMSDASSTGWGATCQNTSTGGSWTRQERMSHINILELKAAFLDLQTFAAQFSNSHILLLIDNTTAIAYINHKGGKHFSGIVEPNNGNVGVVLGKEPVDSHHRMGKCQCGLEIQTVS